MASLKLLILVALGVAVFGRGHAAGAESTMGGSFTIILHGVKGAGKSHLAARLAEELAPDGPTTQTTLYEAVVERCIINVIDTPGFGSPTDQGRRECLYGIDEAVRLASNCGAWAPLRRVYFMLDPTSDDLMPESVQKNIQILQGAYAMPSCNFFVIVSKCDLIQDRYNQSQLMVLRNQIANRYDLPSSGNVLMISGTGCMRELDRDLKYPNNGGFNGAFMSLGLQSNKPILRPGPISTDERLRNLWDEMIVSIRNYPEFVDQTPPAMWKCSNLESLQNAYDVFEKRLTAFVQYLDQYCAQREIFRSLSSMNFLRLIPQQWLDDAESLRDRLLESFKEIKSTSYPLSFCE